MACCCKAGKFAPGIFGNFITTDAAAWGGDYHLNYNYQAPWWGVFSSNHLELAEPYDQPLMDYMPQAQKNARELLDCRGLYAVVGIGPMGLEAAAMRNFDGTPNRRAPFWDQKSNAAYAALNMLMRFYASYDAGYARRILPYLRETAAFWEDYLVWENGRYVIYRDAIHENEAAGKGVFTWVKDQAPDYSEDKNPLLSLGLLRALFRGLIDISQLLEENQSSLPTWAHILAHLSEFPTQERNGRTVFRYTEEGRDWCDGNSLGIQHIYPAGAIGLSSEDETLSIARNTLEEMNRWEDYNAFPTFFTAAARLGHDPDDILSHMNDEIAKHGFPNYFIYYGGGGVECCSTVPACVNEMLMQSHEGLIRLFPVWNRTRDAAFQNLRARGAFLISAELKDGQVLPFTLESERGLACALLCPWAASARVERDGQVIDFSVENSRWGKILRFDTQPGANYRIAPAE